MIFFDGRYVCLAWHDARIMPSYRRLPTTIMIDIGPLEITLPRRGQRLTRWCDTVSQPGMTPVQKLEASCPPVFTAWPALPLI